MTAFTLHLQSATQYARVEGVESFVARDASGAFGVLAGHERMMTVLGYGLARFRTAGGDWHYLALPGGLAYFVDGELFLSARRYVLGDDYRTVAAAVDSTLMAEDSALRSLKESVTRLEREIVRRLWRLGGEA
ncbi:MAG: F0F1 ATP synthase subunit epsilon [Burkholderiales bacterium]